MVEGMREVIERSRPLVTKASSQPMSKEGKNMKGEALLSKDPLRFSRMGGITGRGWKRCRVCAGESAERIMSAILLEVKKLTTNHGVN